MTITLGDVGGLMVVSGDVVGEGRAVMSILMVLFLLLAPQGVQGPTPLTRPVLVDGLLGS